MLLHKISSYAIKTQLGRNAPSRGHFVPKPLVGGFGWLELVLYGIRELAQEHYEPLILLQSEIYGDVMKEMMNELQALLSHQPSGSVVSTIAQMVSYPNPRQTSASAIINFD